MKAIKLTGIQQLEVHDVSSSMSLKDNEVRIRIRSVGVCGSDIHYYNEGAIGSQVLNYPWGVGHEGAGTVLELGSGVSGLQIGQLVAIEPTIFCGQCTECQNDRRHTCLNQRFLGCPGQAEGCMSDEYVVPDFCCVPVSEGMTPQLAALAEPFSIGLYAFRLSQLTRTDIKVAVLGAGPIGLSVFAACHLHGQTTVAITDKLSYRVDFAKGMKAHLACLASEQQRLKEFAPAGYDVVYECCGQPEAIQQALELLRPGGKLMVVGIPEKRHLPFDMDLMRRKEVCIQNVRRQNNCFEDAVRLVSEHAGYFSAMITHEFDAADAVKAFATVAGYREKVIKAMINF